MEATIDQLWVYPLKSGGGVQLEQATLTPLGTALDRKYMLIDSENKFLSQRSLPNMALLELALEGSSVIVSYPNKANRFEIPADHPIGKPLTATMHSRNGELEKIGVVEVGGKSASNWFTEALQPAKNGPLRLVMRDPAFTREVEPDYLKGAIAETNLSDGYPYLVVERSDFELVNEQLQELGSPLLSVSRVRPNIVTSGLDAWSIMENGRLVANDVELDLVKPSTRCVVIRTNQETGKRDVDKRVLTSILPSINEEKINLRKECFGQNAVLVGREYRQLTVGDSISFQRKVSN